MLQISQTENPMCSATIDQMRLRRAMTLPVEFQKTASSGFHSEIQVGFCLLIRDSFLNGLGRFAGGITLKGIGGALRRNPGPTLLQFGCLVSMDGYNGV